MKLKRSSTVLLAAAFAAPAAAQSYTELIREGDPLPGGTGQLVTRIDNVDVNRHGDWLIELDTDAASEDAFVLHNGSILWQEGTATGFTAPAGKVAGGFVDVMDINDNGDVMFITPLRDIGTTTTNGYLLVWNGTTVIETGVTPCNAAGLPAGTVYDFVNEVWQNNNRQLLMIAAVDTGTAVDSILLRVDLDANGAIVSETKLAMEGETLPGPNHVTPVQGFSSSKGRQAINDSGECIWYVDDVHSVAPGSTLSDSNMYRTDANNVSTLLYNEADAFPTDPNQVFDHFSTAEVDLNDNGDFVFAGFDRGPSSGDSWIFKSVGGQLTVLAHEGEATPTSVPGNFLVAGFGFGGLVPMSNEGKVLWFLDWDDPDTSRDTGLMLDDQLLLQEGVSMLGGNVIDDIPNSDSEIAMSDDGGFAILEVVLEDTTGDLDAVFLLEFSGNIGNPICSPAVPNSSGSPAAIIANGTTSVSDNDVTLVVSSMPANQFGIFVNSMQQGFLPNPGGSQGNLCLTGGIGRYNQDIFNSGPSGEASLVLDLGNTPTPSAFVSISGGQTWYFQAWFRDVNPSVTSNLSDAVEIVFQ